MPNNNVELRQKTYFQLSSQIAQLDNTQLHSLLNNSELNQSTTGWGTNHTIVLGESKVFVKRLLVTNIEYDNLFSTKNLYDLPTYCNYGLGSPGFGVFRELITHIKTTNWVLEGTIATFPLMYHYRIMPFFGQHIDLENLQGYLESWGNNANVEKYVLDRAVVNYELVLFLEHIPYILETWLQKNPDKVQRTLNSLHATIDFLSKKEIIHFDAHFRNILTDGEQIYLTDFGLVLDRSFDLTKEEKSFFDRHIFYDCGEVLRNLGFLIQWSYDLNSENEQRRIMEKYGIKESSKPYEVRSILLDHIEQIHTDGDINLDEFYVASILKYRSIIALVQDFFADMWGNNNKDTKFPDAKLQMLLKEAGFIPDTESNNG
jgi:hypothetical protein